MLPEMTLNGDFHRLVVVGLDAALLVQDGAVVLCFDVNLKRQSRKVALHRSTQFPDTRVKSAIDRARLGYVAYKIPVSVPSLTYSCKRTRRLSSR